MMSVMDLALLAGGAVFGVGAGSMCRYSYGGLLPGAWRLCLRARRWLGVGTDRRFLGVCWHGQAFLCLAVPLSRWRMVCGLRVWIGSGGLAISSHVSAGF